MCVNAPLPPDATISVQFLGTNVKASPQHVPHPTSSVPTASISGNIVTNTLFRTSQGKNVMADDTSRLTTYSDTALLSHFNHVFPQAQPWQLLRPRNDTFSSVISALRGYRRGIPLLLHNVPPPNNACGKNLDPFLQIALPRSATPSHTGQSSSAISFCPPRPRRRMQPKPPARSG